MLIWLAYLLLITFTAQRKSQRNTVTEHPLFGVLCHFIWFFRLSCGKLNGIVVRSALFLLSFLRHGRLGNACHAYLYDDWPYSDNAPGQQLVGATQTTPIGEASTRKPEQLELELQSLRDVYKN